MHAYVVSLLATKTAKIIFKATQSNFEKTASSKYIGFGKAQKKKFHLGFVKCDGTFSKYYKML